MNLLARNWRSLLVALWIGLPLLSGIAVGDTGKAVSGHVSITDFGAVSDGQTLNTLPIQSAIDQLAKKGGGTLVIPKGVFLSGAIFLKPGVNLYLEEGAVLKGSTEICNYPKMKTRIEGQFVDWI